VVWHTPRQGLAGGIIRKFEVGSAQPGDLSDVVVFIPLWFVTVIALHGPDAQKFAATNFGHYVIAWSYFVYKFPTRERIVVRGRTIGSTAGAKGLRDRLPVGITRKVTDFVPPNSGDALLLTLVP
jgi:hypothetical protein